MPEAKTRERSVAVRKEQRKDKPRNIWREEAYTRQLSDERFFFVGLRGGNDPEVLPLDDLVSDVSWTDNGPNLTAELTYTKPTHRTDVATDDEGVRNGPGPSTALMQGDRVACFVQTRVDQVTADPLWVLRVFTPTETSVAEGTASVSLASDLGLYRKSQDQFTYKQSKKRRPKGWKAHEVVLHACAKAHIPILSLPTGKHKLPNFSKVTNPIAVIEWAYKEEAKRSGVEYVVHFRKGALEVATLRYPQFMYQLGPTILDATIKRTLAGSWATALTVRASKKVGKKREDVEVLTVVDEEGRDRFGYIHKFVKKKGVDSAAEAEKYAKLELAKNMRPRREVSFTHPGISELRRGDAVRIYLPEESLTEVVFVKEVAHRVSSGAYDMEVTCSFSHPDISDLEVKSARKRALKKKADPKKTPPKPTKAGQRS